MSGRSRLPKDYRIEFRNAIRWCEVAAECPRKATARDHELGIYLHGFSRVGGEAAHVLSCFREDLQHPLIPNVVWPGHAQVAAMIARWAKAHAK
jgi:hypothetical protein